MMNDTKVKVVVPEEKRTDSDKRYMEFIHRLAEIAKGPTPKSSPAQESTKH